MLELVQPKKHRLIVLHCAVYFVGVFFLVCLLLAFCVFFLLYLICILCELIVISSVQISISFVNSFNKFSDYEQISF